MLDFEDAKQLAEEYIGSNRFFVEQAVIEKPYGWYFVAPNKNLSQTEVGDGDTSLCFLVERDHGRIIQDCDLFGSAEQWLENYEKGFKHNAYNLTIVQVNDFALTLEFLDALNMLYTMWEWACGVEWQLSARYTKRDIKRLLLDLPCTFKGQCFDGYEVEIFDRIQEAGCCERILTAYSRD
ncbi:MAG: hypothetical protein KME45_19755 [Stenomitos rutilans HA7619-LM2]|nr:hypothetical protein [Stenomitos rutilans HA7619-LM2]